MPQVEKKKKYVVLTSVRERYGIIKLNEPWDQASIVFLYSCSFPMLGENWTIHGKVFRHETLLMDLRSGQCALRGISQIRAKCCKNKKKKKKLKNMMNMIKLQEACNVLKGANISEICWKKKKKRILKWIIRAKHCRTWVLYLDSTGLSSICSLQWNDVTFNFRTSIRYLL